jgi:hypothetical protein
LLAQEEPEAQAVLGLLKRLTDGGLAYMRRLGSGGDAAQFHHMAEQVHLARGQDHNQAR